MTGAELARLSLAVEARLGLRVDDRIASLDYIGERMRAGAATFLDKLERGDAGEMASLAKAITVGETYFFRHAEQFQAFIDVAVPDRLEARTHTRTLSVLSAGCSSGEEPYTIGMLLADRGLAADWRLDIRGVDANPHAIERALAARYTPWAMRATPEHYQRRYFEPSGKQLVLAPEIRGAVQFVQASLFDADPLWSAERWDVIFCRNVMMYFTEPKLDAFLRKLVASLARGGYLFLGHAETLRGKHDELALCHTHGTFYYRRGSAVVATVAPRSEWVDEIQQATRRVHAILDGASTPVASPPAPPQAHTLDAIRTLVTDDRFDEALAQLDALPAHPATPEALLLRAVVLTHRGLLEPAEDACRRVFASEPDHAGCHYLLALIRETAGDLVGAVFHAGRASELDPSFAMAPLHLGLLARRAGDRVTAETAMARAAELLAVEDPDRLALYGGGFSRAALIAMCQPRGETS